MKARSWSCALLAAALLPQVLSAQEQRKFVPALGWDSAKQGSFVTSVAVDSQNNAWAGTEGKGLWRYDARAKKWTQFTSADGLGDDNIYALAVDKLGRVWAGHLNHGVSVWNGEKWKNYGLLDGPLGDRVFAIATCPTDGDVWIATDDGVARYSIAKDDWDYYTRASGLPSNQIQSVAFNSKGDVILGTQCDGVAIATAADSYKKWTITPGSLQMPNAPMGKGLASSLINNVAAVNVDGEEAFIAATPTGMSLLAPGDMNQWMFIRGQDWQQNVSGLNDRPPAPAQSDDIDNSQPLLTEDWTTLIRQDPNTKNVWIGHRLKGTEVRDGREGKIVSRAGADSESYFVRDICLPQKGPPLIAVYSIDAGGLLTLDNADNTLPPGDDPPKAAPPLPGTPKPADAAALATLTKQLDIFKSQLKTGDAVFLGDDWRTGGDWVGRYGSSYALLCGLDTGGVYQLAPDHDITVGLGVHNKGGEPQARVDRATTDDPRILYSPTLGHRSDAELNDLSGNRADYPFSWEGPDLWVDVRIPAGIHCLSLYFVNSDSQGKEPLARFRDYDVQILPWAQDKDAVQRSQPLARARVTDFSGGVYKQFLIAGPSRFVVRIGRNHSFGTRLQGVFLDQLLPATSENRKELPGFDTVDYSPGANSDKKTAEANAVASVEANAGDSDLNPVAQAASDLWDQLDQSFDKRGVAGLQFPLRIAAYRAAVAAKAPAAMLTVWRWQMAIWTKEDRDAYDKAMADAFKAWPGKPQPATGAEKSDP